MALQMARNVASGGQANVLYICFEHDEQYLLNRLIAMESALAHLPHKTGAIKIQDVRKEILGTWMAEGEANAQMANNPRLRPSMDRIARYGQNLFLMRGSQTASTIDNIRKLVQEHRALSGDRRLVVFVDYLQKVPADPGAGERDREGHLPRQRAQGHRAVRGRADGLHRRRRQGRPQGLAPAQLPPARLVGHQLRGRHHPDPQREVPHRRQGQHRVQPVPGAALPRLGRSSRSRRTAAARTTSTSSSRSTSSSAASTRTAGRCRRSSSRSASTTTSAAPDRAPSAALSPALLAHAPSGALAPVLGSALRSTPAAAPRGRADAWRCRTRLTG